MKFLLFYLYEKLKTSLWFIPVVMTFLGLFMARIALVLDVFLADEEDIFTWMWVGNPEAAMDLFTTMAASLVTMSTLLFSVTMLVITVVSQQYGSHIVRIFKRDTFVKFVLGWFIGGFVYSLFAIVFLSTQNDSDLHPQLMIVFGIAMMVVSFIIFIVFIHHMTNLIQSDYIIEAVTNGMRNKIKELAEFEDKPKEASQTIIQKLEAGHRLYFKKSGYIQSIDIPTLMELAEEHQTSFYLPWRAGYYVAIGVPAMHSVVSITTKEVTEKLENCIILGNERLPKDDFEYHLEQLMEICLKALAPGSNDSYVAMSVIDHLGDVFVMLAIRRFPDECYYGKQGILRLVAKRFSYESFISAAINPIKQNAQSNPQVLIRLLDVIERVLNVTKDCEKREILMKHADYIFRAGENGIPHPEDVTALKKRHTSILQVFQS
jgi:uncharacterized membrane protein